MKEGVWDVFMSYASEDKQSLVIPLANALSEFGVRVWYDEFSLQVGDNLSRSIDKGLIGSNYGLVVLSPSFFAKGWPEYELRGLIAKEISGQKVILPIWHNVTRDDVMRYSPPLADKLAIRSEAMTPLQIALAIISVIRPDISTRIHRRLARYIQQSQAEEAMIEPQQMKFPPPQHETLPPELIGRIRLIRAALLGVYPHSMEFWVGGFRRDLRPSSEVSIWERAAACYLEYCAVTHLESSQREHVFRVLGGFMSGHSHEDMQEHLGLLPHGAFEALREMWVKSVPVHDFKGDEFPTSPEFSDSIPTEVSDFLKMSDKEAFPKDLPDHLIRRLIKETADGTSPKGDAEDNSK